MQVAIGMQRAKRSVVLSFCAVLVMSTAVAATNAHAQSRSKPYDQKLYRLSEILGAVHYLRELCGAKDNQLWREKMQELLDSEGTSALRRANLSRRFNRGYRGYSRTYRGCTSSAQGTIERFLKEAISITDELVKLAN
ncbi:MAG: TIGR02301 family protein [Pseudomonadota bacterium]